MFLLSFIPLCIGLSVCVCVWACIAVFVKTNIMGSPHYFQGSSEWLRLGFNFQVRI